MAEIVAPFTGAWIEIYLRLMNDETVEMSHPSRVRGLKLKIESIEDDRVGVAPFTGAWIEIVKVIARRTRKPIVAPFTGAWIEMRAIQEFQN